MLLTWYKKIVDFCRSEFAGHVTETFITRAILLPLSFLNTIIVARSLGPAPRGVLAVASVIMTLCVQFGNFGMHSSSLYEISKNKSLLPQLLSNSLVFGSFFGILTAVFLGILRLIRPEWITIDKHLFITVLIFVPANILYLLLTNLFLGLKKIRAYNMVELTQRFLNILIVGALVLLSAATPWSIFIFSQLIIVALLVWMVKTLMGNEIRFAPISFSLFSRTSTYSIKSYASCLFWFLLIRLDVLMVDHYLGKTEVGWYSLAVSLSDIALLLPYTIFNIFLPSVISLKSIHEKIALVKKVFVLITAVLLVEGTVIYFFAEVLIVKFFGEQFRPSARALLWLTPAICFLIYGGLFANFVASFDIPWSIIPLTFLLVSLNFVLNLIAIPRYGIVGASITSAICYCLLIPYNFYFAYKFTKNPPLSHLESGGAMTS